MTSAQKIYDTLLAHSLTDVPFNGWTDAVLEQACRKNRLSSEKRQILFPDGVVDLVTHFSRKATADACARMARLPLKKMRMHERIIAGTRARFELLSSHKEAARQALFFFMKPPHLSRLAGLTWHAADALWHTAGDTASDYNHYTKRLLLSGVLSSTTLYWLNDTSKDHRKTWLFLDHRIENVLCLGKAINRLRPQARAS